MMFTGGKEFPLVMISAMYENGGNTTHRILDGHPSLFTYPFESQIGTRLVSDQWSALYPAKYRWPDFRLDGDLREDYFAIIDEEGKVRSRTPLVSKFRDWPFEMDDDARCDRFIELMESVDRTRANLVAAFFTATFDVWKDLNRSGEERMWVGYSPIFGIDAEAFLQDMSAGHILHVVRNPWSAYAETMRRPVPLGIRHYMAGWVTVQQAVLAAKAAMPERVSIVRFEDVVEGAAAALRDFCTAIGIDAGALIPVPTWNGNELTEVYPWGTIRTATRAENELRIRELSDDQRALIGRLVTPTADQFGYSLHALLTDA